MSNLRSSFFLFLFTAFIVCAMAIPSRAQFKVVGYLVNWDNFVASASAVDYTKVSHINIAFVNPNGAGNLTPTTDIGTVAGIVHANNSKVLVSLGGANAGQLYWSNVMASATTRTTFITKIMTMVSTFDLDGIDVDIEGDLLNGTTITNAQYASFVTELGDSLHAKSKLMTAALGTWFGYRISNTTAQQFDWINVMAYDSYGIWTGPGQHSPYANAVSDLAYWAAKVGNDKNKLVLGIPSYGYGWVDNTSTGSYSIPYNTLVGQYARAVNQDSIVPAPGQVIYYNGVPTIQDKTSLAITNASGIMMWTLQNDLPTTNPGSLIKAIDDVVQATLHNSAPTVAITAPSANSTFTEGDTITVSADAMDSDGTIEKVSFYATINSATQNIGDDVTAAYSTQWIGAGPGVYTLSAKAKDNAYATGTSSDVTVTINTPTSPRSFGGPYTIPGKIEAENFDIGKELGYHDSEDANQGGAYRQTTVDIEANADQGGGYNVGWVVAGEWLNYTVTIPTAGTYDLIARVASNTAASHYFHIEVNGVNVSGNINVPNTGGWGAYQNVTIPGITLPQGTQSLKVVFDTGDINLNYLNFSTVTAISDADASGTVSAVVSPNPFSTNAQLKFSLKEGGKTKVTISNIIGASPITVTDQYFAPGDHSLEIGNLTIPSGIYLCVITSGDHTKAIKIIKE